MAEIRKNADQDADIQVLWDHVIRNGETLEELQCLRDDMMRQIAEDERTRMPAVNDDVRYVSKKMLEMTILYTNCFVEDDTYRNTIDVIIAVMATMYADDDETYMTTWDYLFDDILRTLEISMERGAKEASDTGSGTDRDFGEKLVRFITIGAILRKTDRMLINQSVQTMVRALSQYSDGEAESRWEMVRERLEEKAELAAAERYKMKYGSPLEIKNELDRYIIGQEHAKRMVSAALFHHLVSIGSGADTTCQNILLLGETGSGKTMIAEKIGEVSGLPYVRIDSSRLTENGWKGGDIEDVFARLYKRGKLARYGIVIFDEVDKLVNMGISSDGRNVGKDRQSIFLELMEGVTVSDTNRNERMKEYETKNMLFIFTGRFAGLEEIRKEKRRPFGFGNSPADIKALGRGERDAVLREELAKVGVIEELIGRIAYIEELKVMDDEQMFDAVTTSPASELYKAERYLPSLYGKKLVVDEAYVRDVITKMKKTSLGVRGCNNYFRSRIMEILFDSYETGEDRIELTMSREAERTV